MKSLFFILLSCFLASCSEETEEYSQVTTKMECITRSHNDTSFTLDPPKPKTQKPYPWAVTSALTPITKEYFRCKGMPLNPPRIIHEGTKEIMRYNDCSGGEKHSLPLRVDKEFIYPILIELMNYIQERTEHPVHITSGHRCQTHNTYVDPNPQNSASKHMIGAAVCFYVQGLEERPDTILQVIQEFYKNHPRYHGQKDYVEFQRFEKKTTTSTQPWYNKEILVKICKATEARDLDNRHPYPYLIIQVRFDFDRNLRVDFDQEIAKKLLYK